MEEGRLHPKEIKKQLARELTARFHSVEAAIQAEQNFEQVFQKGGLPDDIQVVEIEASEDLWLPQMLVDMELVKSTSDGRRMIKQNAVSLDGEKVTDVNAMVKPQGEVLVKVGKLRYCKVCFR
jgi:tyrosyl-tRNA synthetase